jgi:hypothetical protein
MYWVSILVSFVKTGLVKPALYLGSSVDQCPHFSHPLSGLCVAQCRSPVRYAVEPS